MSLVSVVRATSLIYIGLAALFLAYLGSVWAFFPAEHMEKLGVTATTLPAMNTLKSIMGTGLLGLTGVCIMFLINREHWYRPLFLLTAILLGVRVVGLVVDGMHPRMVVYAVLEVLILVAVMAAVKLEPKPGHE